MPDDTIRLTGIRLKNFKCLKDVEINDIPPMAVFVGENGSGKSTVFEALEMFCLIENLGLEAALYDYPHYHFIDFFQDKNKTIDFFIDFAVGDIKYSRRYFLDHSTDDSYGYPNLSLLFLKDGQRVEDNWKESIGYPIRISDFLLTDLQTSTAVRTEIKQNDLQLEPDGSNVHAVAYRLYKDYPERFAAMIETLKRCLPHITDVEVQAFPNGTLYITFKDKHIDKDMTREDLSDGAKDLYAYLVMMYQPKPPSIHCIEEPERHIYPHLLGFMAGELRAYAGGERQVFISTHSPDFLEAVEPEEIYIFRRIEGYTKVTALKDCPELMEHLDNGETPLSLWRGGYFKHV